jgi:glutamine---fructose-6-phosphate transaminase (isomerizing)
LAQADVIQAGVETLALELVRRDMPPMIAGASLASVEPLRSAAATVLPTLEVRAEIAPILLVQSAYHVKEVLSVRRGFDPDRPGQLRKITETV